MLGIKISSSQIRSVGVKLNYSFSTSENSFLLRCFYTSYQEARFDISDGQVCRFVILF